MKKASQLKAEARASLKGKGMRITTLLYLLSVIGIAIVMFIGVFILLFLLKSIGVLIFFVFYFAFLFFFVALTYKYNAACLDTAHGKYITLRDIFNFSGSDSRIRSFLGLFVPGLVVFLLACVTIIPCIIIFKSFIFDFFQQFATPTSLEFSSVLLTSIILILFAIVLMTPAIMYFYACSLTPFLAHDNPQRGIVECVKKSIVTMKGNKLRLMVLDLTFIGWWLLCYLCAMIPVAFISIGLPMVLGYIFYIVSYIAITCHVLPYWTTSRALFYKDLMDAKDVIQDVLDDPEEEDSEALDQILNGHK